MAIVSIKCKSCGKSYDTDTSLEKSFCLFCGAQNAAAKEKPDDPLSRKAQFMQIVESGAENKEKAGDLLLLWPVRYRPVNREQTQFADSFLELWINFVINGKNNKTRGGIKRAKKQIEKFFNRKDLQSALENTTNPETALYNELFDSAGFYIRTCRKDHQYCSYLFNMVKMKEPAIASKIAYEIVHYMMEYPLILGLSKHTEKIIHSAYWAYKLEYPNYSTLIDEEIEKLEPEIIQIIKEIFAAGENIYQANSL